MRPLAAYNECQFRVRPTVLSVVSALSTIAPVFCLEHVYATCYLSGIQSLLTASGLLAYRWNTQQVSVPSSQHDCGWDDIFGFAAGAHFPRGSHACREREPNVSIQK